MTTVPEQIDHLDPASSTTRTWTNPPAAHPDHGVSDFLTLGDSSVRYLLDVLLRLDEERGVLDDSQSTDAQLDAAHGNVRTMVAALEQHLRTTNVAMLGITSDWPMIIPGRGAMRAAHPALTSG